MPSLAALPDELPIHCPTHWEQVPGLFPDTTQLLPMAVPEETNAASGSQVACLGRSFAQITAEADSSMDNDEGDSFAVSRRRTMLQECIVRLQRELNLTEDMHIANLNASSTVFQMGYILRDIRGELVYQYKMDTFTSASLSSKAHRSSSVLLRWADCARHHQGMLLPAIGPSPKDLSESFTAWEYRSASKGPTAKGQRVGDHQSTSSPPMRLETAGLKALTEGALAMGQLLAITCSGNRQPSNLWQWAHRSSYTLGDQPTAHSSYSGSGLIAQTNMLWPWPTL
ncbi:hypothetical protein BKA93DRAFT_753796 [Sparassis latifolia]